jgi:hypothetical protein
LGRYYHNDGSEYKGEWVDDMQVKDYFDQISKVMVLRYGLMVQTMLVIFFKVKNMVKGNSDGKITATLKESLLKGEWKALENINGQKGVNILANGRIIGWRVKVRSNGRMGKNMMAITLKG